MANHPTYSPSTGPAVAYQPKTTDESDASVQGQVVAHVNAQAVASEVHLGEVGGNSAIVVGTLTRQANTTAYAANTALQPGTAVALALAVARKNAGTGRVGRLRLTKSGTSLTNANFRVHLFKAAPTTLPADAAAFNPSGALDYLGAFVVAMTRAFTDGAKGIATPEVGSYITFDAAAGTTNIFALIEVLAAYTPVSAEVFTVALEVDRD